MALGPLATTRATLPRQPIVPLLLLAALAAGCRGHASPEPRQIGYWYWRTSDPARPAPASVVPDVLYVQVGTLSAPGLAQGRWPADLPRARAYVATWRSDEAGVPARALVPELARAQSRMAAEARAAGQELAGLQLDVDCPTASLPAYAELLRALRAAVRGRATVSVTALLDWFRPGTAVAALAASVDEYVPQFYDARGDGPGPAIAVVVDAERWMPVFEDLGARYRIGVASFGRVQRLRTSGSGPRRDAFRDVRLIDLAAPGLVARGAAPTPAGETRLAWDVTRALPPALEAGDRVEAILPTAASVRTASEAALRFGPHCAGVVYFRWPDASETLVLSPDEVAAAVAGATVTAPPALTVSDGGCAPRACSDLRLRIADRFAAREVALRIEASEEIDYVMAARPAIRLRQIGGRAIELALPAFVGERELMLGRAFSLRPSHFAIAGGAR